MTVAPTVVATAASAVTPNRWTIGYVTRVCDAQSEPIRMAAGQSNPSQRATIVPTSIGRANVSTPNVIAAFLIRLKTLRSSSRPATNMRYSRPMCPSASTSASPRSSPKPVGPIRKPPSSRPMIPGSRSRSAVNGPNRMTVNSRSRFQVSGVISCMAGGGSPPG
jgi:hypothetical protein